MSGIPEGCVEVEIVITPDGEFKRQIVGHGPNTSCQTQDDDRLLEDLLGGLGGADDYGKTDEYYDDDCLASRNPSHNNTPQEVKKEEEHNKTLGFGV